jgi:hypothetical protein
MENSLLLYVEGSVDPIELNQDKKTITSGMSCWMEIWATERFMYFINGKIYICTSNGRDKIIEIDAH